MRYELSDSEWNVIANIGEQPIATDENQAIDAAATRPLWRPPPQDGDLLAQHQVLRLIAPLSIGTARRTPTRSDCKGPTSHGSITDLAFAC
jgi:hypothetical protein